MELSNWTNPDFKEEAHRVFHAHIKDPKYPKPLKVPELLAQIPSGVDLTILAGQFGGGGKLQSQFKNYIQQCSCSCWSSWREAWKDFAIFMRFSE